MIIADHTKIHFPGSANIKLTVIALMIIASCANPVAPTGGPKDVEPPVIVRSVPENRSVNFDANVIHITFDEFIQLRGLNQQFLSSPPFLKIPETRLRGKTLTINLDEELRENTTYTLFFGNAISDFNEGNPIANFRYVFATGPVLDSMELKGKVLNAYTHAPEKEVFVMLYDTYEDSIPMQERPYYISRTNDKGEYSFMNLRNMPYKIFALRDVNSNLIYDQPNEEIAFLSQLVHPHAPVAFHQVSDTMQMPASNGINGQNIEVENHDEADKGSKADVADSIPVTKISEDIVLFLFQEIDSTQRIVKAEYLHPDRLQFVFRYPAKELLVNPLPPIEEEWYRKEFSQKSDTGWFWLQNPEPDTLVLEIQALKLKTDTVRIPLTRFQNYRLGRATDTTIAFLNINHNIPRSGPFNINEPVLLTFSEPLHSFDTARMLLLEDSIKVSPVIRFNDEIQRRVSIAYPWQDTTNYLLRIIDSAFISIYGSVNDSLKLSFKTRGVSDYGNLKINLQHDFTMGQLIVELMDDKAKMLKQRLVTLDQTAIEFRFLLPGKYQVKIIHDENMNGMWDTGSYMNHKQPEKIYIFSKTLELRANWDLEETFSITDTTQE